MIALFVGRLFFGTPERPSAHERDVALELRVFRDGRLSFHQRQRPPGEQHGAGRHARRGIQPALHVGAVEGEAALGEPVEVGRLNDRIAQRSDGVGPLIIGEEEKDIGLARQSVCGVE